MSMPNVMLLMPIAEALGVAVTELLRGENIDAQKNLDANEFEGLVVGSLDLSVQSSIHRQKRNWPHICTTLKTRSLHTAVLYPLAEIFIICACQFAFLSAGIKSS